MTRLIDDFKNIEELKNQCKNTGEPNIVVEDRTGEFVVMTLADYEKQAYEDELNAGLERAEDDLRNGKGKDFDMLFDELEARYSEIKS